METPGHPDDLTADWLTDTLRKTGVLMQARVTARTIQDLGTEKGMTGQIIRMRLDYDRFETDAPRSLIAKFSSPDLQAREVIHAMGFYEREVRFYEQLAARSPLWTPRCYCSAIDLNSGASLLLLEDLAPARNGSWVAGCSVDEAELVVRTIAPFHAVWWQHAELEEKSWLTLRGGLSPEHAPEIFHLTWTPFLGTLGTHVTAEILQIGEWLEQYLGRLSVHMYQEPPCTLIHNDYHADNLFFAGTGATRALAVADWQLTTRGRGVLDVASFLGGSLESRDRRAHEMRLLQIYHTLLMENGVADYQLDQCLDDYRLAMLQPIARLAAVLGFGAVRREQQRGFRDVLMPRYCRAVHDLDVADVLQGFC